MYNAESQGAKHKIKSCEFKDKRVSVFLILISSQILFFYVMQFATRDWQIKKVKVATPLYSMFEYINILYIYIYVCVCVCVCTHFPSLRIDIMKNF
jgi:uncharacterized membrane protein YidH (DUF202 family)